MGSLNSERRLPGNWATVARVQNCSIVRNEAGVELQEYELVLLSKQEYLTTLADYKRREQDFRNSTNVVQVKHVVGLGESNFCSSVYLIKVYLQRIIYKLSNLCLDEDQALFLLQKVLVGFSELIRLYGYFKVSPDMIGVTTCDKEVKVWHNQSYKALLPCLPTTNKDTEDKMIEAIFLMVEHITVDKAFSTSFSNFFRLENQRPFRFSRAIRSIQLYAQFVNYTQHKVELNLTI